MRSEAEHTTRRVSGTHGAPHRYPLFELWVVALTTAAVASLLLTFRRHVDDDLWLHLRIGEELRQGTKFAQLPDPLVALADRPYVPTQWLAEVGGSITYDIAGLVGIHLLRLLAVAALLLFVYQLMRLFIASVPAGLLTLLVVFATSAAWAERPQLLGLVLFSLTLLLWCRSWRTCRSPWLTVPLMWIWACVHGTWIFGLAAAVIITLIGAVTRETKPSIRHNALVCIASVAAVAATPLGPALLTQPLHVSEAARNSVNEWQAPNWENPTFIVALAIAITALAVVIARREHRIPVLLLGGFGGALAAYSVRTVAFGAIIAASGLALASANPRPSGRSRLAEQVPLVAAAAGIVVSGLLFGPPPVSPQGSDLASALNRLPANSRVAVDPAVSGWVLFHGKGVTPLRDLRAEVYSDMTAEAFHSFWTLGNGWEGYLDREAVTAILARGEEPLTRALSWRGWQNMATDNGYELLTRPVPGRP